MSNTYKAIRFHVYGGTEVFQLETLEIPVPQAGEVVVAVHYAGVNPIDWKLRSGDYKSFMPVTFPAQPGIDFSGIITAVGPGVSAWEKGQAVFGLARGSYAEFAVAAATDIAAIPPGVSFEIAATVPVGALTAWQLVETAGVKAGQRVLVHGAAGGVGLFAAQFAKHKGAQVIGTASAKNLAFVKGLGIDEVWDYAQGTVAAHAKDFDIVIDTVGGAVLESSYALVKKNGVLVTPAGQPSAEKAKSAGINAFYAGRGPAKWLVEIGQLIAAKQLVAEIQKIFPLSQAAQAQDLSQGGHGRGRILLKI